MRNLPDHLRHLDVNIERQDGVSTLSDVKTRIRLMIILRQAITAMLDKGKISNWTVFLVDNRIFSRTWRDTSDVPLFWDSFASSKQHLKIVEAKTVSAQKLKNKDNTKVPT